MDERIEEILAFGDRQTAIAMLSDLAKKYPKDLRSRANLAVLSLVEEDLEDARRWSAEARERVKKRSDPETVYMVYMVSADVAFQEGDFENALAYADLAVGIDASDPLTAQLIRARASASLGENEAALNAFDIVWKNNSVLLTSKDLGIYIDLLSEAERWSEALERGYTMFQRFGFERGMGLLLSALHENLDEVALSILSAYLDLRYGVAVGIMNKDLALANMDELETKLKELDSFDEAEPTLLALNAIENEEWTEAYYLLDSFEDYNPIVHFWKLVCGFESGLAGLEEISDYMALEDYYSRYPEYYYHAARAFRDNSFNYDFQTQRPILEKVILMSPQSKMAKESREELCRLLVIDTALADDLYLLHEQAAAVRQFAATGRVEVLDPLIRMLDFENNPYTTAAESALRDLSGILDVGKYLSSIRTASTRRDERIGLMID